MTPLAITRRDLLQAALVGCASLSLPSARADGWPTRSIRFVVPFAPGGSSEIVARSTAVELGKSLGQTVYVENKPGGAGNIAMADVAHADDQHTIILGHIGTLAVNPFIFDRLPYDPNKDFKPITLLAKVPSLYVVHPDLPVKNLKDFVALARSKPGKLNYGSAGNGSAGHLAMEYLKLVTGIDIQHVPYKGTGPNLVDLVAGRTQATSAGTPPLMPHVKSGKLRVIAVGTPKRLASMPDVATVAEQGYPGFETSQWYGLNAPAKTPPAIIKRLADEAAKAAKTPALLQRFAAEDAEAVGSTPQDYAAFIAHAQKRWKDVIEKANVKAD